MMKRKAFFAICCACSLFLSACSGGGYKTSANKNTGTISNTVDYEDTEKMPSDLMIEMFDVARVDEAYASEDEKLMNAIMDAIDIQIHDQNSDYCSFTIRYPDVRTALIEKVSKLTDSPGEAESNALFQELTEALKNEELTMLEESFEVSVKTDVEGEPYLDWSDEALNALTGGLYGFIQEGESNEE